jgi:hypothetical protein
MDFVTGTITCARVDPLIAPQVLSRNKGLQQEHETHGRDQVARLADSSDPGDHDGLAPRGPLPLLSVDRRRLPT